MLVNIEHEDVTLGRIEGLEVASGVLLDAARRAGIPTEERVDRAASRPQRAADPYQDGRRSLVCLHACGLEDEASDASLGACLDVCAGKRWHRGHGDGGPSLSQGVSLGMAVAFLVSGSAEACLGLDLDPLFPPRDGPCLGR